MSRSVLFVCLGNICRSPLAEGAFRHHAAMAGLGDLQIDSAGTGHWHIGKLPDPRSQAIAEQNGVDITAQRARQVSQDDFTRFSHIFAMDMDNLADLQAMAPIGASAQLALLLDLIPGREGESVPDPYYGGQDGFADVWSDVSEATALLAKRF